MGAAEKLYKSFYALNPKEIIRVNKIPAIKSGTLVSLGACVEIVYKSDKWERPKKHEYIHKFQGRNLLCTDKTGSVLFIIPFPFTGKAIVTARGIVG